MLKIEERASLTKQSPESERNSDRRPRLESSTVIGFSQDEEGHWFVLLSCGHTQHLRHQPPWQSRAWVLDPVQRQRMTGQTFCCGWCANAADNDSLGTENSR
ncbi:DUF3565 domain-containing protein [Pseudomonas syringae USA007]|uniref:Pressure-regulated protein n=4 Tax=Pseudomonas syringae group TaxID=136849 RepID=A0A3M4SG35_9PSED|nr:MULTISPECIES: DUF3565 domain-containing protein [Pseudomonas syringae group]KPZ22884.1 Pressure-regulated protein [Pseudomonas syringae pv. viburni]MCR8717734.1 DUF3565 domain-containing protein [Pseudomonas syringae]MDU8429025.1 DUF3565 domain-containing protein [Pseudomonas syringae pv. actinidifoliorum]MDU8520814.1 DUF3565 domain-containing protein [Pseudomonas syringae pv. actinidifoliorum]MDU8526891.1 DUF3565 domain-containing protein [Pseudomonas syringae pv. actinidifoliorum]